MPKHPPKKRAHTAAAEPVVEGVRRETLDEKGRNSIKERLSAAADVLLADPTSRDLARPLDESVAFVEMGAYVKAREALKTARDTLADGAGARATALAAVDAILRELPAGDAAVETIAPPPNENEVGQFDQEPHSTEATMTVPVPAATRPADVEVVVKRDFLTVKVKTHERQPHVIYGRLAGCVQVDACAWTLDGEGDGRVLVVSLEKESNHPCWPKLLGDPVDYWADSAGLEGVRGMSGLRVSDDAETAPVWTTAEEARRADAASLAAEEAAERAKAPPQ